MPSKPHCCTVLPATAAHALVTHPHAAFRGNLPAVPLQVETELREVDAKFSRLHGVPAGRALDLYGRVIGGPATASPETAPVARKQGSRTRGHASTVKCARAPRPSSRQCSSPYVHTARA